MDTSRESQIPGVLVINLEHRVDRYRAIRQQLEAANIEFVRVPAINGQLSKAMEGDEARFVSKVREAVFLSHLRAWKTASRNPQRAHLILEDDARFSTHIDWYSALPEMACQMAELNLDVLQLGHLRFGTRGRLSYAINERLALRQARRLRAATTRIWVGGRSYRVRLGTFRAGAHSYLLSPRAARTLSRATPPAMFHNDQLLARLAPTQFTSNGLLFGCVCPPLVYQGDNPNFPATDSNND